MERVEHRMRADGRSDEEIARVPVAMRNEAKDITRAGMSPEAVKAPEARDMAKYGNPLGPTTDQQFAKYGSWAAVIDAAPRSNASIEFLPLGRRAAGRHTPAGRPARSLPAGFRPGLTPTVDRTHRIGGLRSGPEIVHAMMVGTTSL
ncbi:hypothetical protein [Streptomyces sp. Ncost-T10-10d]|uniref:hypothetical protein n=1 Tax=Streptomyces sp. Ncost-T10-10d TaxID=1839774 RepID=UPI00081E8FF5|nr:hypothetical protein [Streptomyces sp. Ncost-T10-10d]SCF95508.1 hypothetical protein GA0115254_12683 [Streptomyces sp. Ncost-T10-10d]